jgi:hypothetical protein
MKEKEKADDGVEEERTHLTLTPPGARGRLSPGVIPQLTGSLSDPRHDDTMLPRVYSMGIVAIAISGSEIYSGNITMNRIYVAHMECSHCGRVTQSGFGFWPRLRWLAGLGAFSVGANLSQRLTVSYC